MQLNSTTSAHMSSHATNGSRSNGRGPITNAPSGELLLERAILLVTDLRRLGVHRKVANSQVEVDADKETIFVHKKLLDAPQLQAILTHDSAIRAYINAHCLPSFFRKGVALLPIVSIEEVDAKLDELNRQRETLVEELVTVYPDLVRAAQVRLRGLFDPRDYASPEAVRAAFSFEWRYVTLGVPTTLAAIDREIFKREREKFARQMDEAAQNIQTLLRVHMAQMVRHMQERLTPGPDGQAKVFRNSLVSNLSEFLQNFDARNLTDDRELAAVAARARELLAGVDARTLRQSENVREEVRSGFADMQRQLDRMVTNRPARRIVLDRAPVAASAPATSVVSDVGEADAGESNTDESNSDESAVYELEAGPVSPERVVDAVPLAARVTPEFRLFSAARAEAQLPWRTAEHAESFVSAYQAAAGSLAGLADLTPVDYSQAAQLIRNGELRW